MSGPRPYYGPDEPYETILLERSFIAGGYIAGAGYGIQVVLYVICALYLWSQRKRQGKSMLFLLAYITLLVVIATIFTAASARTVQDAYVDNRNYPGGPWQYFLKTQYLAEDILFYAMLFVLTFLSDLLVLWRCWVIWTASGRLTAYAIIAFPTIMLIGSFVLGTLWTIKSSQPGLSLYSTLPLILGTSYYVVSLAINIIVTILITTRLIMYRKTMLSTLPNEHAKHYVSLATIIIESSALYSVFAIIFIATYGANNPVNQIFLSVASACQEIAGYLIILRVAQGRAWNKDTLTTHLTTLPTMQYANREQRVGVDTLGVGTQSVFVDAGDATSSNDAQDPDSVTWSDKPPKSQISTNGGTIA
ncbi:hypothetical protein AMATHDRAFT_8659 [Amanita thiersii Skay4041]|uniref:G-protein coupled receptors family 1 profile domain-containing protein n=1 Tax=Amanita thiersii Skay4041 TaxID=703135 RepID=A0A2A9NDS7_9AGAR|nr:hypothetical protein AMATHDRAFT_8659 [Amanita thiersii Skay4041]